MKTADDKTTLAKTFWFLNCGGLDLNFLKIINFTMEVAKFLIKTYEDLSFSSVDAGEDAEGTSVLLTTFFLCTTELIFNKLLMKLSCFQIKDFYENIFERLFGHARHGPVGNCTTTAPFPLRCNEKENLRFILLLRLFTQ